jgi:hypothetical protein
MHNKELAASHFTTSAIHIVEQLWPRADDRSLSTVYLLSPLSATPFLPASWKALYFTATPGPTGDTCL